MARKLETTIDLAATETNYQQVSLHQILTATTGLLRAHPNLTHHPALTLLALCQTRKRRNAALHIMLPQKELDYVEPLLSPTVYAQTATVVQGKTKAPGAAPGPTASELPNVGRDRPRDKGRR
jgi:hypothetical protein